MDSNQVCIHTNDKQYRLTSLQKENIKPNKFSEGITHSTIKNNAALNNQIWDENEIVYWKLDSEYQFIPDNKIEQLCKLAFLETSFETPLTIRQHKRKSADAQIVINWFGAKDEPYFRGKGGVLAFAYGPGRSIGGDITMNADQPWWLGKPITLEDAYKIGFISKYDPKYGHNIFKTYDPLHTMKHEGGGHSCGMRHIETVSEKFKAIMYPYYNGVRKFGTADLAYLHDLYGAASVNHKIKEILLNRIQFWL